MDQGRMHAGMRSNRVHSPLIGENGRRVGGGAGGVGGGAGEWGGGSGLDYVVHAADFGLLFGGYARCQLDQALVGADLQ
jgi:hypothetical protein